MSGAPILQNGKMIGAMTHVSVNDLTRGYGTINNPKIMKDIVPINIKHYSIDIDIIPIKGYNMIRLE